MYLVVGSSGFLNRHFVQALKVGNEEGIEKIAEVRSWIRLSSISQVLTTKSYICVVSQV
jgi:hypothetical protein